MIQVIKELLLNIIQNIDSGNSNISENDAIEIAKVLSEYTRKDNGISKYSACEYLNMSRATFDNYVREGKIPKGKHEIGFKELRWYKKDLDEFVKKSRDNHSLRSKLKSQLI